MAKQLLFIPGPVTCAPEILAAMAKPMIDHRGPEFASILSHIAEGMKPVFGTEHDVVLLGGSGTGGLEAAVSNAFSPGDRVLAAPIGVFGDRLAAIARTYGLDVDVLSTAWGDGADPNALRERLGGQGARPYAGILLTHNETSTGAQNDMAALSAAIGDHPATVIVDSVSGLGASAFRMDAWRFDIVVTASQKALAVPPGMAMVAVSARAWERISAANAPRFYFDLAKARSFAELGQTPWTPPVSIAFALVAALDRYHAAGAANAYARHARYASAIRAFADTAGIELFSRPGAHSVTVVAMNAPAGVDVATLRADLRERHGLVMGGGQASLKGKIVRMGTMGELSADDVAYGLQSLESSLRAQGATVRAGGVDAARAILEHELALR